MYAAEKGNLEVVKYLLDCNANVNLYDNKQKTALIYVVESVAENDDVLSLLVKKKKVEIDCKNLDRLTPLMISVLD